MQLDNILIQENVSLARYTTFKIGGSANFFVEVKNKEELQKVWQWGKAQNLPIFILGGGSNILFSDEGWNGLVIKISFTDLVIPVGPFELESEYIIKLGAGVFMVAVSVAATKIGLSGLEWASGLPGTAGGAVRGNAGAFRFDMKQCVKAVEAFIDGEFKTLTNEECEFGYRSSIFKTKLTNAIITDIILTVKGGDIEEGKKRIENYRTHRKESQPPYPSAGSVFKNYNFSNVTDLPEQIQKIIPETYVGYKKLPAAWVLEQAGLKGTKVGGAEVSTVHGNFIVNIGGATAKDVLQLIQLIKTTVKDKFNIELEEEVMVVKYV